LHGRVGNGQQLGEGRRRCPEKMAFESSEKIRRIRSAILTVVFGGGAPGMRFQRRTTQAASITIKWQDNA